MSESERNSEIALTTGRQGVSDNDKGTDNSVENNYQTSGNTCNQRNESDSAVCAGAECGSFFVENKRPHKGIELADISKQILEGLYDETTTSYVAEDKLTRVNVGLGTRTSNKGNLFFDDVTVMGKTATLSNIVPMAKTSYQSNHNSDDLLIKQNLNDRNRKISSMQHIYYADPTQCESALLHNRTYDDDSQFHSNEQTIHQIVSTSTTNKGFGSSTQSSTGMSEGISNFPERRITNPLDTPFHFVESTEPSICKDISLPSVAVACGQPNALLTSCLRNRKRLRKKDS